MWTNISLTSRIAGSDASRSFLSAFSAAFADVVCESPAASAEDDVLSEDPKERLRKTSR
jgi:hypothetical protein